MLAAMLAVLLAVLQRNTNVRLLACLVDEEDIDDSDYRFLVDRQHVKYVTTAPGTFRGAEDCRTFEPILLSQLLPPFPIRTWNKGHVAKDPKTGEVIFARAETAHLAGVENLWHPVKLNELDLTQQDRVRQRVHISTHPKLNDDKPVLIKLAVWSWEIPSIEVETNAYQWINDSRIGPKFLGARVAGPGDIESCKKTLARLHQLGIKSGDVNKHNFLVRDGHDVVLVDFETARRNSSQELEDEMSALENSLEDRSFRGGVESVHGQ
ncbi:hypothetical protein EV126DRAFT_464649 [Verticillium dahliae]|nr:hypothetical protein EV126DRAFT_464649 [Verticillium dahliae]